MATLFLQLLKPRPCKSSLLPPFLSWATFTVSKGSWQDLQHTPDPTTSTSCHCSWPGRISQVPAKAELISLRLSLESTIPLPFWFP